MSPLESEIPSYIILALSILLPFLIIALMVGHFRPCTKCGSRYTLLKVPQAPEGVETVAGKEPIDLQYRHCLRCGWDQGTH